MQIVGQKHLRDILLDLKDLPRLLLLVGDRGSGKTELTKLLAQHYNMEFISIGNKIDDVRQLIESSVAVSKPTLFSIGDGDSMTIPAMNAMLKITEEPPKNVYIVIEATNRINILNTIQSRATTVYIDAYSQIELEQIYDTNNINNKYKKQLLLCCKTPGQIIDWGNKFDEVYDYAFKVYSNILGVSTGNAFKICNKINLGKDEDKIELELFFQCFLQIVREAIMICDVDDLEKLSKMIRVTCEAIDDLHIKAANKKTVFDIWVLDIRRLRE